MACYKVITTMHKGKARTGCGDQESRGQGAGVTFFYRVVKAGLFENAALEKSSKGMKEFVDRFHYVPEKFSPKC